MGALARRAGVAKGTLSGWERGLHLPRIPELDAVLTALAVSPIERRGALARIDAPRSHRSLALLSSSDADGLEESAPMPGHLLRALRLRRGLTLNDVAQGLGTSVTTVSRWERSLNTPSSEQLERLLAFLGARLEERIAMTTDRLRLWPPADARLRSLDVLEQRFEELWRRVDRGDRELLDLELLAWQAEIWPLAADSAAARELLGRAWAYYAEWLTWDGRRHEAGAAAARAIHLLQTLDRRSSGVLYALLCAVNVRGRVIAEGTARNAKAAAVEWLQRWLPGAAGSPWGSFLYHDLAEHAWWAGQPDAAHAFAQRACCLAEGVGDPGPLNYCRFQQGDLLLRSGRPQEAIALISPPEPDHLPYGKLLDILRWAHALRDVGEHATAADWLAQAYALIEQYHYPRFRALADALARGL
jgi:transcriptional regulator with XRE-family HTH domain